MNREVELLQGRFDGLKQQASSSESTIVITEMDPTTGVAAQYVYKRLDERRFIFEKCYAINA